VFSSSFFHPLNDIYVGLVALKENRLQWFGVVIDREDAGITYWQYAELQQTA
jgi:hypothetical protein